MTNSEKLGLALEPGASAILGRLPFLAGLLSGEGREAAGNAFRHDDDSDGAR